MIRPGFLIPVFFLPLATAWGQPAWNESSVSGAGGTFVSRPAVTGARYNQAGLGWITRSAYALQHAQPFIIGELGVAALSVELPLGSGGMGMTLSTFGLEGYRQSSLWLSYGMRLHPRVAAGIGLQLRHMGITDKTSLHLGLSCALGLMIRTGENLVLGGHVMHPASWTSDRRGPRGNPMIISLGWSYSFTGTATWNGDLRLASGGTIGWCQGLEIRAWERLTLLAGLHNHPFAISGGTTLRYRHWSITIATEYIPETGLTPSSTLSHER